MMVGRHMSRYARINLTSFDTEITGLLTFTFFKTTAKADPTSTSDNSDVEEISSPNTKKRKVATHVEVLKPRKRPDTRSANEKRLLTGDYGTPADAVPLEFPRRWPGMDGADEAVSGVTPAVRMSRNKPGAGTRPWKVLDTLRNNAPQAARDLNWAHPNFAERRTYGGASANKGRSGDGFSGVDRAPAAKKRKIGQRQGWELQGDPIDVSDDENGVSRSTVTSVNGKPYNDRMQKMVRSESQSRPFEGREFQTVDEVLRTERQKSRRKPANGNRSSQSQTSSRASPVVAVNGCSGKTPAEAVILDDDTSQEISQHHVTEPPVSSGEPLPDPKAISKGVFERNGLKQRRQSENSVEYTRTETKPQMPPPATKNGHANPAQQPASQPRQRRTIRQDDMTAKSLRDEKKRRSEEPRLDQKFIRDPSSQRPANLSTTRRSAMKAESGHAGAQISTMRDSIGSVDELAGPTTVGSVSPEKVQNQTFEHSEHGNRLQTSRSPSASDLKPTTFTQSQRAPTPSQRRVEKQNKRSHDEDDRHEIPLVNFYATSCILTGGTITMRYDNEHHELDIYHNGDVQVVEGERCTVHISRKEVSSIVWSKESEFILLKGPSNSRGVSNGYICFTLEDIEDKSWLASRLSAVTGDSLNFKNEPVERMKSTFDLQAKSLFKLAEKRRDTDAEHRAIMRSRLRHSNENPDGKDDIKYEEDQPQRPGRRRAMQGAEAINDDTQPFESHSSQPEEYSRYFDSGVRRSTRQTKTVRRKSPSPPPPPKWTKINQPQRWPHSVVFPNQGARRVTVDFQDLERLDEGEFLNDNVISFALRRIEEAMAPEHKERVHFFNSFFYTALTTKNGKKAFNYDAVKRWTKSKDLLGCDYVVVPINIDFHWFVAIVCNLPNLSRRAAGLDEEEEAEGDDGPAENAQQPSTDLVEAPSVAEGEQSAGETSENTKAMRNLSLSDHEGMSKTLQPEAGDGPTVVDQPDANEDAESPAAAKTSGPAPGRKAKKRGPPSYDPDKPAIITLDSFGTSHTAEVRYMKDYLKAEAEAKRGIEVDIGQLQGANIKDNGIPTQSNFCDCGVYLVGYIEQFAKNPREFVTKALGRSLGKHGEFEGFDPSQKRDEIREELLRLQKEQEAEHKAKKVGKKGTAAKTDDSAATSAAASAAATPKPESEPTSKVASPARQTSDKPAAVEVQRQQRPTPSWTPRETSAGVEQPQESQDTELDFEAPRALKSPPRNSGTGQQLPAQPFQEESFSQGMLDDPSRRDAVGQPGVDNPNELLDNLSAVVRRNSQQRQLSLMEQAGKATGERAGSVEGEGEGEADHDDDNASPSSDGISNKDIIDLGDEEDELSKSEEIPDSQEQRQGRKGMSARWAGTRKVFD